MSELATDPLITKPFLGSRYSHFRRRRISVVSDLQSDLHTERKELGFWDRGDGPWLLAEAIKLPPMLKRNAPVPIGSLKMFVLKGIYRAGYAEIYELEHDYQESEAGYGSHKDTGKYVARKGDQFLRFTAEDRGRYGFGAKRTFNISDEKEISAEEFATLSKDKQRLDTPEQVKTIEDEMQALLRRFKAEQQLNDIKHKCSACGANMVWRSGQYGPFWGCMQYPVCMNKKHMSAKEKALYEEYAGGGLAVS